MAAFRDYRDAQGRRAFTLPLARGTTDPEIVALDRLSMGDYFDRAGWSSPELRWYVDYCCRDDYGCTLDTTSAWAGWHYFCSRPADVEYLTWPEGNGRIVRHYLERVGDRVRTGMLAYRLRPGGLPEAGGGPAGGATAAGMPPVGGTSAAGTPAAGVEVDILDTRTETAVRFRARHCIYALPRFTARHVIEGYPPEGLDAFTYCPWMVANLTVRRLPDGAAWDNVLVDSPSLGYVVATHQDLRVAPGRSVLTYYLPLTAPNPAAARRWMLGREWRDWVSLILADLGQAHPDIESLVSRVDVMLWGHAMIRPVPGFVWGGGAPRRRRAARGRPLRPLRHERDLGVRGGAVPRRPRRAGGPARARPSVRELALTPSVRTTARTPRSPGGAAAHPGRAVAVRRPVARSYAPPAMPIFCFSAASESAPALGVGVASALSMSSSTVRPTSLSWS